MKKNYDKNINLRCATCGGESFTTKDDKSYIKCNLCDREYLGGYEELKEFNQELIEAEVEVTKKEVVKDLQKEITDMFKKAFK